MSTSDGVDLDDYHEFQAALSAALKLEYSQLLDRFGLAQYSPSLYSGRYFRSRLAHHAAGVSSPTLIDHCKALEMMHTATLVHDDIIDKAVLRRSLPTLTNSLGPDEALLVGNMIATRAISIAALESQPLTRSFLDAYDRVNTAQEQELRYRGYLDKTAEQYYEICRGKTSAMLELALLIGAAEVGADPGTEPLVLAVREIGIAFQVVDDCEDLVAWLEGAELDRSKSAQFDIDLGNYTLPVVVALEAAAAGQSARSLANVDRKTWSDSVTRSMAIAFHHLDLADSEIAIARKESDSGLVHRVEVWFKRVADALHTKKLDLVVQTDL
ncbi:polyprenyl synthetase family protein [Antrihabitans sp. YC2-6]|uniref:polyprenyl synthetase family protein n=1 Tax=Antrihabitans sp. YC2-6 TaxID=2799498 RepID=UPI0018F5FB7A|nr:polyprenyl synthetase family protein [Antrihabitans sp. YC2-6]MBJ8343339.1 polyprenyl synthetase family protein [Antrihabitans sp. YC2-6]